MRKVIIFGSSGFIGSHVKRFLTSQKIKFIGFDIEPEGGDQFVDVREKINLGGEFNSEDLIINLAAVHKTPGHTDPEYFKTNLLGAINICDFAREKGIKSIVFTSSISVYGMSEFEKSEKTLPMPNTPYGISKLTIERYLDYYRIY